MNGANHISQDDLYLFALQLLPENEMHAAALHLKECPLCRTELALIQGDLVTYAMTAELEAPPAQARERFLSHLAKEPKANAKKHIEERQEPVLPSRNARMFQMETAEERAPRRTSLVLAWAGWAVAAGIAVFAVMQFQRRQALDNLLATQQVRMNEATTAAAQIATRAEQAEQALQTLTDVTAMQVSLHVPLTAGAPPKADPEAHAAYVQRKGSLVFVASHLDPLQPSKTYELWLLPAEPGRAPIPAGLFKPDANGNAHVVMPDIPKDVAAKGFGVTVEDEGGAKTPTPPIVLAGL